ncbi:hypothetical protein N7536_000049 [Penicillium majusculum]|nr:hypothetical protein N7536_000049 [Penicillium majusculum]
MPKEITPSRTRAITAPTRAAAKTRAGAPAVQSSRPFPTRVGHPPRPSNPGTERRQPIPSRGPERYPQENTSEEFDLVHADCKVMFDKADRDRRQFTAKLREASDTVRKSSVEKAQLEGQFRKLVLGFNESKQKAQDLEKRLDEATLDRENYVSREEHEKALRDLLGPSSSVIKMIESNINASQNVYMSTFMPPSDVAQGPWADESDQFAMLNHPVPPDDMEPMLSTSDPLAGLPDFDTYEALP